MICLQHVDQPVKSLSVDSLHLDLPGLFISWKNKCCKCFVHAIFCPTGKRGSSRTCLSSAAACCVQLDHLFPGPFSSPTSPSLLLFLPSNCQTTTLEAKPAWGCKQERDSSILCLKFYVCIKNARGDDRAEGQDGTGTDWTHADWRIARGRERKEWRDVESQKGKERDNKTAVNESQPAVQTD